MSCRDLRGCVNGALHLAGSGSGVTAGRSALKKA